MLDENVFSRISKDEPNKESPRLIPHEGYDSRETIEQEPLEVDQFGPDVIKRVITGKPRVNSQGYYETKIFIHLDRGNYPKGIRAPHILQSLTNALGNHGGDQYGITLSLGEQDDITISFLELEEAGIDESTDTASSSTLENIIQDAYQDVFQSPLD